MTAPRITTCLGVAMMAALLVTPGCSEKEKATRVSDEPGAAKAAPSEAVPAARPAAETAADQAEPAPGESAGAGPAATPAGWTDFTSPEGGFAARFPSTPSRSTLPTPTLIGNIDQTLYSVSQSTAYYAASFADYPADAIKGSDPKAILDGARDGAVKNVNGKLVSEEEIEIDGHPGRQVRIEAVAQGTRVEMVARVYLVNNRMYQMIVVQPGGGLGKSAQAFLESFELTAAE